MTADPPTPGITADGDRAQARAAIAVEVAGGEHTLPRNCVDAEPYALRVIGDHLAPDLPAGCIIIVDPSVQACAGHYVIADSGDGATLGALAEDSGQWWLHPKGIGHAGVALQPQHIRGVVVQRAGRRRRDHKRFD